MTAAGASQTRALVLIAGALLLLFLATFFPGFLSADSVVMLNYALGNIPQTNWHPSFGVLLWRLIHSLVQHMELLWVVQISAFIGAAFWLARSYQSRLVVLLAAPLLLLFPPIASNLPGIWKDCWALLFLLLSFTALKHYQQQRSGRNFALTLLFAALAAAVRIDYAAMALLLVLALSFIPAKDAAPAGLTNKVGAIFLPISLFLVMLASLLGLAGRDVQLQLNPWLTVAIWDMAGISQQGGQVTYPDFLQAAGDLPEQIQTRYNCITSDQLVYSKGALPFNLPGRAPVINPADEADLKHFWLDALRDNPAPFLQHRLCIAQQFFGWGNTEVHYVYPTGTINNPFGMTFERSTLHRWVYPIFKGQSQGWMFRYWIHLLLGLATVLALLLAKRQPALAIVIWLSMLAAAARVLVLPATDFRYGLWITLGMLLLWLEGLDALAATITSRRRNRIATTKP